VIYVPDQDAKFKPAVLVDVTKDSIKSTTRVRLSNEPNWF